MKIAIVGPNYAPEPIGIAVYTTGLAQTLAARGHDVEVIAGQPYYPNWAVMDGFPRAGFKASRENGVRLLRAPHYVPGKPSGARRLLHHASFATTSALPTLWKGLMGRPDLVIAIAPSLLSAPVALAMAKAAGAKSWLHIQDFEIDAAVATGMLPARGRAMALARRFETGLLKAFDTVSTISPQMRALLVEKGVTPERAVLFPNWADIDAAHYAGPSSYRRQWGITTRHVALYSGAIGAKQGIDIIIEAARRLQARSDLTFVICGEGPNRDALDAAAQTLPNLRVYDLQPKERLGDLLALASVHLLPQLGSAADLVLPSKLANMLASGRPVIATASAGTGLAAAVAGNGMVTQPEDGPAFATAIANLLDDDMLRAELGQAARASALTRWARGPILDRACAHMERTAASRRTAPRPAIATADE